MLIFDKLTYSVKDVGNRIWNMRPCVSCMKLYNLVIHAMCSFALIFILSFILFIIYSKERL